MKVQVSGQTTKVFQATIWEVESGTAKSNSEPFGVFATRELLVEATEARNETAESMRILGENFEKSVERLIKALKED